MDTEMLARLKGEGSWLFRMDFDGLAFGGFLWEPLGEWTEAPDWDPAPRCGGGLHGQGPLGAGYAQGGARAVLCETEGAVVGLPGKVKVRRARVVLVNDEALLALEELQGGGERVSLDLSGYQHPLPAGFTRCGGYLSLSGHKHPLPAGFTHCGGSLGLRGYKHPLPAGFTHCGGHLNLSGYKHPLPAGFAHCGGSLDLRGYGHPLPAGFTHCGGYLSLRGYKHPRPAGFTHSGGKEAVSHSPLCGPAGPEQS
jgi:hypothetical protein